MCYIFLHRTHELCGVILQQLVLIRCKKIPVAAQVKGYIILCLCALKINFLVHFIYLFYFFPKTNCI